MITGSQIGRGGAPIGPPSSPEPNHNQPHDENDEDDYSVDYYCHGGVLSICAFLKHTSSNKAPYALGIIIWGSLGTPKSDCIIHLRPPKKLFALSKKSNSLNTDPLSGLTNFIHNKFQCYM